MSAATYISAVSAAVSIGAASLSWRTARGAKTSDAYKLAEQLYDRLTVGETATARSALEFYRRAGTREAKETREVLDAYFALLWCFSGVRVGRRHLVEQRRINNTGPAVEFLDEEIRWHVEEWVNRWEELRGLIQRHIRPLDDHHSLEDFCKLSDEVLGFRQQVQNLREQMADEKKQWQSAVGT